MQQEVHEVDMGGPAVEQSGTAEDQGIINVETFVNSQKQ